MMYFYKYITLMLIFQATSFATVVTVSPEFRDFISYIIKKCFL